MKQSATVTKAGGGDETLTTEREIHKS